MVAEFYRGFNAAVRRLPQRISPPRRIAIVTARLGELALNRLCNRLNKVKGLHVRKVVVRNNLFGSQVTVSGLMAGCDIASAIRAHPGCDFYLLPSNCLNTDGLFLDDMAPVHVEKETGARIIIVPPRSVEIIKCLLRYMSTS
jgi:NifB/MoaA-like Fe-S oxidoreductase